MPAAAHPSSACYDEISTIRDQAVRVVEQHDPGGRQLQPLAFAHEQRDAELLLELLHARRDVRLPAMKLAGGARNAAGAHDGLEDALLR
jgi:hypothetical protein